MGSAEKKGQESIRRTAGGRLRGRRNRRSGRTQQDTSRQRGGESECVWIHAFWSQSYSARLRRSFRHLRGNHRIPAQSTGPLLKGIRQRALGKAKRTVEGTSLSGNSRQVVLSNRPHLTSWESLI